MKEQANILTKKAQQELAAVEGILITGISNIGKNNSSYIWNNIKDTSRFPKENAILNQKPPPEKPSLKDELQIRTDIIPEEPNIKLSQEEELELLNEDLVMSKKANILLRTLTEDGGLSWWLITLVAFLGLIFLGEKDMAGVVMLLGLFIFLHIYSWIYWKFIGYKRKKEYGENQKDIHARWEGEARKASENLEKDKENNKIQNEIRKGENRERIKKWEQDGKKWNEKREEFYKNLEKEKQIFYKEQSDNNSKIEARKVKYLCQDEDEVITYCKMVLESSKYPDFFTEREFKLDYNNQNKILVVEYNLPTIENFPRVDEVKYIQAREELKSYELSESQISKMFDSTMYKITLRTLYELFVSDSANAIDMISFNGWINSINKANGRRENTCILSIQVKKSEFMDIDLKNVDPKACFKSLKGVGSSKLSGITAIQPIMQLDRNDKRFVSSYDVADSLHSSMNLAEMDWEDFEHLIREVFEKEFSKNGGEVKVTQASRDGGVDAIAFDPDPIRGGKIVIQAKRYTNTVGVSAVRDLYGTVMNEGANKGILVTTADYGPDAYEFAKGKPITIMNGGELLYLLEKHGKYARIDLKEAKKNLAQGEFK